MYICFVKLSHIIYYYNSWSWIKQKGLTIFIIQVASVSSSCLLSIVIARRVDGGSGPRRVGVGPQHLQLELREAAEPADLTGRGYWEGPHRPSVHCLLALLPLWPASLSTTQLMKVHVDSIAVVSDSEAFKYF